MAFTLQQVVDKGRKPLNDVDKARHSDSDLLGYANDGILLMRNKRPDVFFGQYLTLGTTEQLALTDTCPLPAEYIPALADYITARGETLNDEAVLAERASLFFRLVAEQTT